MTISFQGWTTRYVIENPEAYRNAIRKRMEIRKVRIGIAANDLQRGDSLTQVIFALREANLVVPGKSCDQESLIEALGFDVKKGFTGKWTKGGFKYCSPSTIVIEKEMRV